MFTSSAHNLRNVSQSIDKLENDIITLMWNTHANNQSFLDVFTDSYKTEDGIDKSQSSYQYDPINCCLTKPTLTSLILITVPWSAVTTQVSSVYSILYLSNSVPIDTSFDFFSYISFDDGDSYTQIISQSVFKQASTKYFIRGDLGIIVNNNLNRIRLKVVCNSSTISIYGVSVGVR